MTPVNLIRKPYGADARPPQRIERPGTEELWLALNEAAYVRGDIEIDQFEHGLEAIWGDGVLPSWIVMPLADRPRRSWPGRSQAWS